MSTSLEIEQQVAVLMRELAETKESERKAAEEEEYWRYAEEGEV